jgi:hypothetical protein
VVAQFDDIVAEKLKIEHNPMNTLDGSTDRALECRAGAGEII